MIAHLYKKRETALCRIYASEPPQTVAPGGNLRYTIHMVVCVQLPGGVAMQRMLQYCRRHWAAVGLLLAGGAGLCLFWAARGRRDWMDAWLQYVSMPFKRAVSALVDPLPFSVCEASVTVLILFVLFMIGRTVWLAVRRGRFRFGVLALHFCTAAVWIYLLVCAFWGTQYYGTTFAEKAGMTGGAVEVEDLAAVAEYFARQANATADTVPRDEDGVFAASVEEILADSAGVYDAAAAEYPCLDGPERSAKPAFYSKLMSAAGFTGYLCPLFGESTVNVDCPAVFLPVTIAHEFAHQRGVAAEQEANFCGIYASVTSGKAAYVYSGWLYGYVHLFNALYSVDTERAMETWQTLCPQARADIACNDAYWASWEGPVETLGETVYEGFLQSYDQELGMRSYGACVDLLVEKYLPLAG